MQVFSTDGTLVRQYSDATLQRDRLTSVLATAKPPVLKIETPAFHAIIKRPRTDREYKTLQLMHEMLPESVAERHVVAMLPESTPELLFLKPVVPMGRVKSLKDFLHPSVFNSQICNRVVASILVQIILVLKHLHGCHFAHNDMKADNILLQYRPKDEPMFFPGNDLPIEVQHYGVQVVLIDTETATGDGFPPLDLKTEDENLEMFGLGRHAPFCAWTDLHLVMMELWTRISTHKPWFMMEFAEFLSFAIPPKMCMSHKSGNICVTSMNRLTTSAKQFINSRPDIVRPLDELLAHKFLAQVIL